MYRPIRFTEAEAANLFFTSDLHHAHDPKWPNPIWKMRGFNSCEACDNGLISNWNEKCDENSIVFHLGDLVFNDSEGTKFSSLIRRLRYKQLYLLIGNHTSGQRTAFLDTLARQFPNSIDSEGRPIFEVYPLHLKVDGRDDKIVTFLPEYAEIKVGGKTVCCCHYPLVSHNEQARNSLMLCGHSHGNCELTNKITGKGFRLDVGVDSWGEPISYEEIRKHFRATNRTVDSVDHHNKEA